MMRFTKFSVAASSFALLVGTIAAPVFAQTKSTTLDQKTPHIAQQPTKPTTPDQKTPIVFKPRMQSMMIQGKVQYVSQDQNFAIVKTPHKTFLVKVDRDRTVFQTPDGERLTGERLIPDKASQTLPQDIQAQLKQDGNPSVLVLQAQLIAKAGK